MGMTTWKMTTVLWIISTEIPAQKYSYYFKLIDLLVTGSQLNTIAMVFTVHVSLASQRKLSYYSVIRMIQLQITFTDVVFIYCILFKHL